MLKARTLRDADRHYTLFTETRGKIVVLAKGSRRGRSKMAPHLAPFGVVDVMVAKGRLIDRLAGASMVRPCRVILGSLPRTALAQSFLLAVDALTKRELPDQRIYGLLAEFLDAVESGPEPEEGRRSLAFDAAVTRLLDLLGFALELEECVSCRSAITPDGNALNPLRGGLECEDCRDGLASPVSENAIKALRFFRRHPVAAATLLRLPPQARREVSFLTDLLLTTHLEGRFHALQYLRAVA